MEEVDDTNLMQSREFVDCFKGNVDLISVKSIVGWAIDTAQPDKHVKAGLWIGDRCFLEKTADMHRQDLLSVRDDGCCAFEFRIPELLTIAAAKSDMPVNLVVRSDSTKSVLVYDVFKEFNDKGSDAALERTQAAFLLSSVLNFDSHEVHNYPATVEEQTQVQELGKFVSNIHEPEVFCRAFGAAHSDLPVLSRYVRYTLGRLNLEDQFQIDLHPDKAKDALLWYLESYGAERKPLRVPLSKGEINYCNSMLGFPGCSYRISRAHFHHLLKHRPDFAPAAVLNDDSSYLNEIYTWVCETTHELNLADVLVPFEYVNMLKSIGPLWRGRRFAFNKYFEILRSRTSGWEVFSVNSAYERGLMYLVAWLESSNPDCMIYMPDEVRIDLFETVDEKGFTFFEKVAVDLLEYVDMETVSELYSSISSFQKNWYSRSGFDTQSRTYLTIDRNGNRRHLPCSSMTNHSGSLCELQIIGPFESKSGLGQAVRLSVAALQKVGIDAHLVNFDVGNPSPKGFKKQYAFSEPRKSKINLVHLNAESAPFAAAYLPDVFSDSYNIGYFFWELDTPAKCHELALDMFDEIWVSTEYGVKQHSGYCQIPVTNVGMTYQVPDVLPKADCREFLNDRFSIDGDETVFLTAFDSFSFVQRKNPLGVIKAFLEAFPANERVRLIIKTHNRHSVIDQVQQSIWRAVDRLINKDQRIILVNETLEIKELMQLKKSVDCYVSLHKSEGWGFDLIESMLLEVPVITTEYSGNLEFCNNDNCWMVRADEVYLKPEDYIYVKPGQKWGEPRLSHAVSCLKEVYQNPELRYEKINRAKEFVCQNFSPAVIGQRYAKRLEQINKMQLSQNS